MRFNILQRGKRKIKNYEGADAYRLGAKEELYSAVVASTLNDNFYEKGVERLDRIRELIHQLKDKDAVFIAQLAIYARTRMYLRSVPLVLAVELAKQHNGDDLVRRLTGKVIRRADEITEILAYYQLANQRQGQKKLNHLSKQLQKGISDAFNQFDGYQFAKYNRGAEVKLRDALFLVHPKAKDEPQQALFDRIAANTLDTAYTWETELSKAGQEKFNSAEDKAAQFRQKWEALIRSGKLGYMAMLRNLRNILQAEVSPELISQVAERLADPKAVAKSKQFPFRFIAAYRELQGVKSGFTPVILDALEGAISASAANITGFDSDTRVLVASDLSGSMQSKLSARSSIQYMDVGLILSCLLKSRCRNVITGVFGQTYELVATGRGNILANVERLRRVNVGHATNGYLAIRDLIKRKVVMDKVMIFTDCQLWDSNWGNSVTIAQEWEKYKRIAPDAKLYLFDLAGYGAAPLDTSRKDVYLIGGWSDKVFDILDAIENGSTAIAEIEKIEV